MRLLLHYNEWMWMMSQNRVNLGLRFLLELVALVGLGMLGRSLADGMLGIVLMIAVPVVGAVLWASFRTQGDRAASDQAPVMVPGVVRLVIEAIIFGGGVYGYLITGRSMVGLVFGVILLLHYVASYDRVLWMLFPGRYDTP